jgi:hypothetical protein
VRITNREKLKLERFGCTLRERTGVFLIDWNGKSSVHAAGAEVFARLAYTCAKTGPIVLLAFEITPTRPLPYYFYFPFDLNSESHRNCLSQITSTGEIRLSLVDGKRCCNRTHQLKPYLRLRGQEIYAEALELFRSHQHDKYDFDQALEFVECHVRIPQLLHRVFLGDTLREVSENIDEAIKTVPNEDREYAKTIVRVAAQAFEPYYLNSRQAFLDNLQSAQVGLTCIIDMHRLFVDNPAGLTELLSDGLAATFSRKQLDALSDLVKFFLAAFNLPFKQPADANEQPSGAKEQASSALVPAIPELPVGLASLVESMSASGITKDTPRKLFDLMGLEVGGKPGRPAKDYSREYEWKASGLSWTKVARRSLEENPEIRSEFRGRAFQSLLLQEQISLKNRIREGVRSYAERTGRTFPIGIEETPDQENPAEK